MDHEQRCAALYQSGTQAGPIPDGLLVIGETSCTLCKNSMRNNGYAMQLADGRAVTWLNIADEAALNRFYATPGIAYDYEKEYPTAAGQRIGGTPIYLWVQDGRVTLAPLGGGEQPEGGLEQLAKTAAEKLAAL